MAEIHRDEKKVVADPYAELAVKNAKYVKNCTEMYLAQKGINVIAGFERFVNLESLWLNGNKIEKIENLDGNFRIKQLYVHNNRIATLEGSLKKFTFLETFYCFNNDLENLDKCLEILSRLFHLRTLDLFGNPIAEEDGYRLRVIAALSSTLEILDKVAITEEERKRAKSIFSQSRNRSIPEYDTSSAQEVVDTHSNTKQSIRSAEDLVGDISGCTKLLLSEINASKNKKSLALKLKNSAKSQLCLHSNNITANKSNANAVPIPKFVDFSNRKHAPGALNEWEKFSVVTIFREFLGTEITKSEFHQILEHISDHTARVLNDADSATGAIFTEAVNRQETDLLEPAERSIDLEDNTETECTRVEKTKVMNILLSEEVPWDNMSATKCIERAQYLFHQAQQLQRKIAGLSFDKNNNGDASQAEQKQKFEKEALRLSTLAGRLRSLSKITKVKKASSKAKLHHEFQRNDFIDINTIVNKGKILQEDVSDGEETRELDSLGLKISKPSEDSNQVSKPRILRSELGSMELSFALKRFGISKSKKKYLSRDSPTNGNGRNMISTRFYF